jgi:hypothetical protein
MAGAPELPLALTKAPARSKESPAWLRPRYEGISRSYIFVGSAGGPPTSICLPPSSLTASIHPPSSSEIRIP